MKVISSNSPCKGECKWVMSASFRRLQPALQRGGSCGCWACAHFFSAFVLHSHLARFVCLSQKKRERYTCILFLYIFIYYIYKVCIYIYIIQCIRGLTKVTQALRTWQTLINWSELSRGLPRWSGGWSTCLVRRSWATLVSSTWGRGGSGVT